MGFPDDDCTMNCPEDVDADDVELELFRLELDVATELVLDIRRAVATSLNSIKSLKLPEHSF